MGFSRRSVLAGLSAATSSAALPALAKMPGEAPPARAACRVYLHDIRIGKPAPVRKGRQIHLFSGEISAPWFKHIKPALMGREARAEGESFGDAVFCLRTLAADHGWHLQVTGDGGHPIAPDLCKLETIYRWELARMGT